MEEPIKAILNDIPSTHIPDIAYEEDADPETVMSYIGQPCELTLNTLVSEDDFEANYWDATFEDGFTLHGLSGIYFERR